MKNSFMLFAMNALYQGLAADLNTSDVPTGEYVVKRNAAGAVVPERNIAGKAIFVQFTNAGVDYALAPKTVRDIGAGTVPGLEPTETGFKVIDGTKFWMSTDPYLKAGVAVPTIAPRGQSSKDAV